MVKLYSVNNIDNSFLEVVEIFQMLIAISGNSVEFQVEISINPTINLVVYSYSVLE
jgi:hypothetical protein